MRGNTSRSFLLALFVSVFALIMFAPGLLKAQGVNAYTQTNLVSSSSTFMKAYVYDSNLVNPWGIANGPTTPIWIANQATSTSTLYFVNKVMNNNAGSPFVVDVPKVPAMMQGPTGIAYNPGQSTGAFPTPAPDGTVPAFYIYDDLNGTISAWSKGSTGGLTNTVVVVDTPGAVYKGLAIGQMGTAWTLYAADATAMGGIKVFNSEFKELRLGSKAFMDPNLPSPPSGAVWITFNVENVGGNIFVTYAPMKMGMPSPPILNSGDGVVAEFTPEGKFMRNVIVSKMGKGPLDDPWALEMAPAKFGAFSNDLLVGNFGNGTIDAYKPTMSGAYKFEGVMKIYLQDGGTPVTNEGRLWDLSFGNGHLGAMPDTLFITTGGPNPKMDGLFAAITPRKSVP